MNYEQALRVVRNVTTYESETIREAANVVLGTCHATEDEHLDAGSALGFVEDRNRRAVIPASARCSDLDAHPFSGAVSAGDY